MKDAYIGKDILELYDKYDQDFGLLDERWASEKDRRSAALMETTLFTEYIDKLYLIKTDGYSTAMKAEALKRIEYIEGFMDPSVAETLRKRVFGC